jgi:hypothetical protein
MSATIIHASSRLLCRNRWLQVDLDLDRCCRISALRAVSGPLLGQQSEHILLLDRQRIDLAQRGACTVRSVRIRRQAATADGAGAGTVAAIRLQIDSGIGRVELVRELTLYDAAPALRCVDTWSSTGALSGVLYSDLLQFRWKKPPQLTVVDWFTCSDQTNHRLRQQPLAAGTRARGLAVVGGGLFIAKEGPAPDSQPVPTDHDAVLAGDGRALSVVGTGFDRCDATEPRRANGVVIGLLGDPTLRTGWKQYQQARYGVGAGAGEVLANSWPAFHLDVTARKMHGEIAAAKAAGLDCVFIDDGWFSTFMGEVDQQKFPGGLGPVAAAARDAGLELGVWMNPFGLDTRDPQAALWDGAECQDTITDGNRWNGVARSSDFMPVETVISEGVRGYRAMDLRHPGYRTHLRDRILTLAREHGIRRFKFDLYQLRAFDTLTGDPHQHYETYRAFLTDLQAAIPRLVISMDVTRSRRPCFDFGLDFGRLFLENRGRSLRDHRWYQPWISQANLWDAAHLAPTQRLELEVMPQLAEYPVDYVMATALVASPLYWGSLRELNAARRRAVARYLDSTADLRAALRTMLILPLAERPRHHGWSGFLAVAPDGASGWLLAYRHGPRATARHTFDLRVAGGAPTTVRITEPYGWQALAVTLQQP